MPSSVRYAPGFSPGGFSTTRGARSRNCLSMRSHQRSPGSFTCESAEISFSSLMACLRVVGVAYSAKSVFNMSAGPPRDARPSAARRGTRPGPPRWVPRCDGCGDAAGPSDQALGCVGEIVHVFGRAIVDRLGIEHDQVRGGADGDAAAVGNAEEVGDLAGQPVDRTLQRESLPLAHPL